MDQKLKIFIIIFSLALCGHGYSQTVVTGTVTELQTGEPMFGANVLISGSSIGVTTDGNGTYTLNIPERYSESVTLSVSYVGFASLTKKISLTGSDQTVNFELDATALEEVLITARHRNERLQDVGQSIAAISSKEIEAQGIADVSDLAGITTGLDVADRGPNRNEQAIRGIARVTPINDLILTPNLVANYLDEIPINSPGSNQRDLRLFDVDRVEVLRGPQGTLFGEGAVGGAIRTFTKDANLFNFDYQFQTSLAKTKDSDNGDYRLNGMFNIPIVKGKLGIRAVGFYRQDAGFIDNTFTNINDANDFKALGGRAVLLWKPTDKIKIRASYTKDDNDIGADWVTFSSDGLNFENNEVNRPGPDQRNDDFELFSLKSDFEFKNHTLISITGFFNRDFDRTSFDPIQTNNVIRALLGPTMAAFEGDPSFLAADVNTQTRLQDKNFSQEFRFLSNYKGPFNYTLGAFYRDSDFSFTFDSTSDVFIPYSGTNTYTTSITETLGEQLSLYGEFSYDISPKLKAIAGLRWFQEERIENTVFSASSVDFTQYFTNVFLITEGFLPPDLLADDSLVLTEDTNTVETGSNDINTVLPKFALEYRPSDDVLLFGSFSQGARIGGSNSPVSVTDIFVLDENNLPDATATEAAQQEAANFDEDKVSSYEVGIKSTINNNLRFNAGLYYNKWNDIQTLLTSTSGFAYFDNVGEAHSAGVELEMLWRASDNFTINAGLGFVESEFDETTLIRTTGTDTATGAPQNLVPPLTINEGDRLPNVPNTTYNLGVEYRQVVGKSSNSIFARYNIAGRGEAVNRIERQEDENRIEGYALSNLRVGYQAKKWGLTLFANNLFDKQLPLSIQASASGPTSTNCLLTDQDKLV